MQSLFDEDGNDYKITHESILNPPALLCFHAPDDPDMEAVALRADEFKYMHRQLVCWCNIQRFWYYVIGCKKCRDSEYDYIERLVAEIEKEEPVLSENPFSPTRRPGSDIVIHYPRNVYQRFMVAGLLIRH